MTDLSPLVSIVAPLPRERSRVWGNPRVRLGGGILGAIVLACLLTLPATASPRGNFGYDVPHAGAGQKPPARSPGWMVFGTTKLGESLVGRCGVGGLISLTVGVVAAVIAVALGVTVGVVAGYAGGWVDHLLMRAIEVLDCLPYILMVVLLKLSLQRPLGVLLPTQWVNVVVLFTAIGGASWLTMARVIRGQVLGLRSMPFVDAARAMGTPPWRVFVTHLLPNLVGPITVYAALTVPGAILQESTLSFLGIGIQPPLPTWGSLASDGMSLAFFPVEPRWWLLLFPCMLLAATLAGLNLLGDGLRDALDPRRRAGHA